MFGIKKGDIITFIPSKVKEPYKYAEAVVANIAGDRISCNSSTYPTITTLMDVWCVETVNGRPYNPIDKSSLEWKTACALNFIDDVLMNMGDDYKEYVEYLCEEAGIMWAYMDIALSTNKKLIDRVAKKAYYFILKKRNEGVLTGLIEKISEECDDLQYRMVHFKCKKASQNPIVKAVCTIATYVKEEEEMYRKIKPVQDRLLSTDMELCNLGYYLGTTFFRHLDGERFIQTNDAFTVGSIMLKYDMENELGYYVFHATKRNPSNEGYSMALNRMNGQIVITFYEYNYEKFGIKNVALNCHMVVTDEDKEYLSRVVADVINKF